jgi:hypothetical protein
MNTTMTFDDLDSSIFDIIDAADEQGFVHFVSVSRFRRQAPGDKLDDLLRNAIESAFPRQHLFTAKLSQSKKWLKDIEASRTELPSGDWLVRLNLARFLLLPGEAPAKELAQLRGFFEQMKPYFEANADGPDAVSARFLNERDSKGRVFCSLRCAHDEGSPDVWAEKLMATAEASPALIHFMREQARCLQKVGPWSWFNMTEECLYREHDRPWKNAWLEKRSRETAVERP